jgi:hypothetical protein
MAACATSLTLLAVLVAGSSPGPSTLLLAVIGLIPSIVVPLWTGFPEIATNTAGRHS